MGGGKGGLVIKRGVERDRDDVNATKIFIKG